MIFISNVQNYIPIKLCTTAGSIDLIKIAGTLRAENIKLIKTTYGTHFSNRLERSYSDFQ